MTSSVYIAIPYYNLIRSAPSHLAFLHMILSNSLGFVSLIFISKKYKDTAQLWKHFIFIPNSEAKKVISLIECIPFLIGGYTKTIFYQFNQ